MTPITLADGQKIVLEPLERSQRRLGLKNFDPCSILLNNDLSAGIPAVLENLHEQYLLPPLRGPCAEVDALAMTTSRRSSRRWSASIRGW